MVREYLSILFLLLVSSGCTGGLNCPFDRPDCCDNVLFGCGPFDLPEGCSCGDYFGRSAPLSTITKASTSGTFSGTWQLGLNRVSSTCSGAPVTVNGTAVIRHTKSIISIYIPGYGTLRGTTRGSRARVSGTYGPIFLGCKGDLSSTLQKRGKRWAAVQSSLALRCPIRTMNCDVTYTGKAIQR